MAQATGWIETDIPARLDRLARLVRAVPVRRLVYPSGFDRLPEVVRFLHNLDANSI